MEMSLSAERSTRSRRYDVSKAVLIRICGLPSTIADELTYPALAKSIDRAQLLSERILECAQRLSDELYAAVSAAGSEREDQRALLRMRRDVFNNRMVPADIAQRCVGYLPNGGSSWAEWRTLRTELDEHNRRAERALNAWLHDQRTGSIPRLATIRDFRKGLLTSSESFENSLQSYLCFGGRNLDKRLRRTEHALISYLFRTTHKPSPFGTFTSVALGMLATLRGPRRWKRFILRVS